LLKIRLSRVGKKRQPSYRVVVADARKARDGAFVEIVGHYNPRTEPTTFVVDAERVQGWLSKGAQPTDRVQKLLAGMGLLPAKTWGPANPPAKAAPARPARASTPAAAAPTPAAAVAEAPAEEPAAEAPAEEPVAEAAEEATAEETEGEGEKA
jgi:small subunit ribosomal protein S16